MVEPAQHRRQLLSAPAQSAQPRPGFSATFNACSTSSNGAPCGASSQSGACGTPRAGPRPSRTFASPHPESRRSPSTSRTAEPLGDDLVVVDTIDRPHMVGSPDPHPVLRRLHTAIQLVERQYSEGALVGGLDCQVGDRL